MVHVGMSEGNWSKELTSCSYEMHEHRNTKFMTAVHFKSYLPLLPLFGPI